MVLFSLEAMRRAADEVHAHLSPTPLLNWPLLSEAVGTEVWVKHENHLPTGAFKIRGGLLYLQQLKAREPECAGVVTATRGNHGQSIALAAGLVGLKAVVVVPEGNSVEKNAAIQALGAELLISGRDFDEAREVAAELASRQHYHMIASFDPALVMGVASYALELFTSAPDLDVIYAPIGLGSGICGLITARNLLQLQTKIVGVVSEQAPAYKLSFDSATLQTTSTAATLADGLACRQPDAQALAIMQGNLEHIASVSDAAIREAIRLYFRATHNVIEGAGAAPLAAALAEAAELQGKKIGLIASGANIDGELFAKILQES